MESLGQLLQLASQAHRRHFGQAPQWLAWAPGRVNLIGEHTDYNEGYVLPLAINRWVVAAASPGSADQWEVVSEAFPSTPATFGVPPDPGEPGWSNYVRGVVRWATDRGIQIPGLRVTLVSNLPVGGGLSSSAALEVAAATLIEAVTGTRLDGVDKARGCQWAEHQYAGAPCGLMDQLAAVFGRAGHALLIDCRVNRIRPVPLDTRRYALLVFDSGVRHELAQSEYPRRRQACAEAADILSRHFPHIWTLRDASPEHLERCRGELGEERYRYARHVVTEDLRTSEAAAALVAEDYVRLGRLMVESHRSLRNDFEVSCPELDLLVDSARDAGAIGARMTGGGFGGCAIALATKELATAIGSAVEQEFQKTFGRAPSWFVVEPVDGAGWSREGQ